MSIRGRVALVTGGAHRLGRAITLELAAHGAHVAINYHRSETAARDTERCAAAFGVAAMRIGADAADTDAVAAMVASVEARLGPIDFLVASAGVFRRTPVDGASERDWGEMMRGNFETFRVPAAIIAPSMQARGRGAIVAISDVAALRPWGDYIPYCVAKRRVLHHARQLASAFAPTVRVNCILPGPVLFPPDYPPAAQEREVAKTLLRRAGHASDIARAVLFLLENDYLTGAQIPVDGGRLLV